MTEHESRLQVKAANRRVALGIAAGCWIVSLLCVAISNSLWIMPAIVTLACLSLLIYLIIDDIYLLVPGLAVGNLLLLLTMLVFGLNSNPLPQALGREGSIVLMESILAQIGIGVLLAIAVNTGWGRKLLRQPSTNAIITSLHDPTNQNRAAALMDLGMRDSPSAVTAVIQATSDPDPAIHDIAMAFAIARHGLQKAEALHETNKPPDIASGRVHRNLALTPIETHVDDLLKLAWYFPNEELETYVVKALAELGSAVLPILSDHLKPLETDLLEDVNPIRLQAARMLGELGDRTAVPALLTALKDPVAEVRATAIDSLTRLGDVQVTPEE